MRKYNNLPGTPFAGTAIFLFLLLWGFPAVASDNDIIRQHIMDKAAEQISLKSSQVTIYVDKGFVLLTGTVRIYLQKMDFEQIAWKTTGVADVENEIKVQPMFPRHDTAIKEEVQAILLDYKCFHGTFYIVHVSKGVVSVTGVFHHPRDVRFLKHKIAEIAGVIAIDIHITALIAGEGLRQWANPETAAVGQYSPPAHPVLIRSTVRPAVCLKKISTCLWSGSRETGETVPTVRGR